MFSTAMPTQLYILCVVHNVCCTCNCYVLGVVVALGEPSWVRE